jgi:uncharacterized protein YbbC (DUF1343 family)
VAFVPIRFTPKASTFTNQECGGVAIQIIDRSQLQPVDVGIAIALTLYRLYPNDYAIEKLQPLLRDRTTFEEIKAGRSLAEIKQRWSVDLREFTHRRERFLIYK